ncbi:Uncharacterised protein [uncultured archaeon]|nr:Uncharacterised protein [uncultured archaeon]
MATTEPIWDEEKQKQRLLTTSKFLFLFIVIYIIWIVLLITGVYFLKLGDKWAILTVEQWIWSAIVLISIAIGIEIILLIYYILLQKKQIQPEKQKDLGFLQGRQVHNYTIPFNAIVGIFSKTFISIDEKHILNLRYQMVPPYDLWGQKQ